MPARPDDHGIDRGNPISDRVAPLVSDRPWLVVCIFLTLTLVFAAGAGGAFADQEAGAGQFEEDVPEFDDFEAMQDDFVRGDRPAGTTTAQLFVDPGRNVLSRDSLLRMIRAQDRLESHDELRVVSTTSPATLIAAEIDPTVASPADAERVLEGASDRQLDAAIRETGETLPVSTDFSAGGGTARVAQIAMTFENSPQASDAQRAAMIDRAGEQIDRVDGYAMGDNVVLFADVLIDQEVMQLLGDTAIIVFPAAILLILSFLAVAYRDPIDLGLGLAALLMTLIWTFGFMGYVGIPFSDSIITVFPLLLAVGIDFGIHIINRYREERLMGVAIGPAMSVTGRQLSAAFLIVVITTVFALGANLTAPLAGLRNFGIVGAVGMIFTFCIFGIFLPAAKVAADRLRDGTRFPTFGSKPLGREGSFLGRALSIGTTLAKVAPAVILVSALLIGGGAAAYGTGVGVEFDQTIFFPDEERVEQYQQLPGPLAPGDYQFMRVLSYLEDDFEIPLVQEVTIYADDRDVRADYALVDVDRAIRDPPDSFEATDRRAEGSSIFDAIESEAARNPEFDGLVRQYDRSGDGAPDREVDQILEALFAGEAADETADHVTTDRSAIRFTLQPTLEATDAEIVQDSQVVAEGMRLDAVATGQYIVFQSVADRISESAVSSLIIAFILTAMTLIVAYWYFEGRAVYGLLNLIPVVIAVALLAGSMRYFGVALSPFNAPILGVAIGLGVDYSVHFMHRFVDEYEAGAELHDALETTILGTGGALTGSMITTVSGLGVLYFALIPLLVEYGLLLALGVFYAWATSILVLPSAIVVWARLADREFIDGDMLSWGLDNHGSEFD